MIMQPWYLSRHGVRWAWGLIQLSWGVFVPTFVFADTVRGSMRGEIEIRSALPF